MLDPPLPRAKYFLPCGEDVFAIQTELVRRVFDMMRSTTPAASGFTLGLWNGGSYQDMLPTTRDAIVDFYAHLP